MRWRILAAGLLIGAGLQAAPAAAEAPGGTSYISLGGEVKSAEPDEFVLDYGAGTVVVRMDDWWQGYERGHPLTPGDRVTVQGFADDDVFDDGRIEASGVYVEKLGTWFYADSENEGETDAFVTVATPVVPGSAVVRGTVRGVDARSFTIHTGAQYITVDVAGMPYDPLDGSGTQRIEVGDRVAVAGFMSRKLFERRLQAKRIVEIADATPARR